MRIDERIVVTKLTRKFCFHRDATHGLKRVLARAACIVSGAASGYDDLSDVAENFRKSLELVEHDLAVPDTGLDGRLEGCRLLLEHEVFVASLFRCLNVPSDAGDLFFKLLTGAVKDLDRVVRELGVLAVFHINGITRICHKGRHIRSEVVVADSHTEDERARFADCEDLAGLVGADDSERI